MVLVRKKKELNKKHGNKEKLTH